MGRQRVPICDKKETLRFLLESHPVLENAVVMPQMQAAGRPHTGEDTPGMRLSGHKKNQTALRALIEGSGENCLSEIAGSILPDTRGCLNVYPGLNPRFWQSDRAQLIDRGPAPGSQTNRALPAMSSLLPTRRAAPGQTV